MSGWQISCQNVDFHNRGDHKDISSEETLYSGVGMSEFGCSILIQRSVSVLFVIISYLFNFTGFCSYSEALLWFCYQSKFVEKVSLPRGG